jgi:hypothetical protein
MSFFPIGASPIADDILVVEIFNTQGITTGVPIVSAAVQVTNTVAVADNINTSQPTLNTADITENNIFLANAITTSSPIIPIATMFEEETFACSDITFGAPTLTTSIIEQRHFVDADNIITLPCDLNNPQINQTQILLSNSINTNRPTIDVVASVINYNFSTSDITTNPFILDTALQSVSLYAPDLITGIPTIPILIFDIGLPRVVNVSQNSRGIVTFNGSRNKILTTNSRNEAA